MGFEEKLKNIKVFLTDVDGVLTDGTIFFLGEDTGFNRVFNVTDGYGLKLLMRAGIHVGIISAGNSKALKHRVSDLGIPFSKLGQEDKRQGYSDIVNELGCSHEEVLYIGDDLFDIPLLKRAGVAVTTANATDEVKQYVDYITTRKGGDGAVREVVDILRRVQDLPLSIPDFED